MPTAIAIIGLIIVFVAIGFAMWRLMTEFADDHLDD